MSERLRITYNVGNAKTLDLYHDIRDLQRMGPRWIGFQEIGDREPLMRDLAKDTGWRFVMEDETPASSSIGFLCSPDLERLKVFLKPLTPRTYVGKNVAGARDDGYAQAKYILGIRYKDEFGWQVAGVTHFVPSAAIKGNHLARALHNKQVTGARAWLNGRRRDAILCGDFNATPGSDLMDPFRKAHNLYMRPSHGSRAIDGFIVPKRFDQPRKVKALDGHSSDHRPVAVWG